MVGDSTSSAQQVTLLRLAASGDARAARDLTAMLAPRVFTQAYRMLGHHAEAEDVTQDALMKLWRIAPNWDAGAGAMPSSWLYRVVANLCIDRMRRKGAVSLSDDELAEPQDPSPSVEAQLQSQARCQALYGALAHLPDRQRQAVVLRHIEGWANPDIAEALSVSVEAVESLISRGKRALAGRLAAQKEALGFHDDEA